MAQDLSKQKSPTTISNGNGTATPSRLPPVTKKRRSIIRPGAWLILGVVFLAAILYLYLSHQQAAGTTSDSGSHHGGGGAGEPVRVITAKVSRGNIGVYLQGLGSVTPLNTVTVRTRVDGQLMKILFTEGETVQAGQQLVQIDDRPYQAQLAQYNAQKEHDQALLDNAKIDLDRYQKLWSQDSIPQQTLATQQALVKQDQGTVDSDQALIQATQLNIIYCNITAPISGRIGLRLVDEGNLVHATDTNGLLVITQVQPITVIFTIPEDNIQPVLDKMRAGQTLEVDAYDRSGFTNKLAQGSLLTTDNQIDPTTGTLRLRAQFPNDDQKLFPNQFVNVRLLVEMKQNVALVPVAAIQHGTQGAFVYVVDTNANTVKMRNITLSTQDADQAEVTDGLTEGETVVTDGVDKLQNGSKVILSSGGSSTDSGTAHHSPHKQQS
ncbi:MAG: MdtA/MuxA family multidrug efflux RND transporter periplasmic adaptor subunit [Methylacidiphilales bacterium]|nr:MdtA/MuxA family multidrug efflux RND transporter periplasmic adaptor subunit [Candidatus Methylacidiphilales bacterium]